MLFPDGNSALVRLSDSLKDILNECQKTSSKIIQLYDKNKDHFEALRTIAKQAQKEDYVAPELDKTMKEMASRVPQEDALHGIQLQRLLHSQALQVVLTSCFTLESYINSLAYYLFKQEDYLGLIKAGHETTADIILDSIDKMRALDKWEALGRFNSGSNFDKSKPPFQNCRIIFNFRNDIVHDKVADYSSDRPAKRYNNRLPDPVFGMLELTHASFAANTYWDMTIKLHRLLVFDVTSFHRHYNLMPWYDQDHKAEVEALSLKFDEKLHPRS